MEFSPLTRLLNRLALVLDVMVMFKNVLSLATCPYHAKPFYLLLCCVTFLLHFFFCMIV